MYHSYCNTGIFSLQISMCILQAAFTLLYIAMHYTQTGKWGYAVFIFLLFFCIGGKRWSRITTPALLDTIRCIMEVCSKFENHYFPSCYHVISNPIFRSILFPNHSGSFSMLPAATISSFGSGVNSSANYGLVFTSAVRECHSKLP